jgi:hypothetical protein
MHHRIVNRPWSRLELKPRTFRRPDFSGKVKNMCKRILIAILGAVVTWMWPKAHRQAEGVWLNTCRRELRLYEADGKCVGWMELMPGKAAKTSLDKQNLLNLKNR